MFLLFFIVYWLKIMLFFFVQVGLEENFYEILDFIEKFFFGLENLQGLNEDDIQVGFIFKEVVYQEDKVIFYCF